MVDEVQTQIRTVPGWKRFVGGTYLRIQKLLTQIGTVLGWHWLIYNPLVLYGFERAARRDSPIFVAMLQECFPGIRTAVDVGCGTGNYVQRMTQAQIDAVGVEYSPRLRRKCEQKGIRVFPFDVTKNTPHPVGAPFDLAISLEVAEHLPASLADDFVRYFDGLAKTIVFTAAQPGQEGTDHINLQPRAYWIEKFTRLRFEYDDQATQKAVAGLKRQNAVYYLPSNISVFTRRSVS